MENEHLPLVTFALFAYNQETFIRDAVRAALAQDYPNLEIILSDDCSTDNTFKIMNDLASSYAGPHQIVLNRNATNLGWTGIVGHVNKVVEMSRGELFVFAAGDDISLPQRVRMLVDAWIQHGCTEGSLHSAILLIDENGKELEVFACPVETDGWHVARIVREGGRVLLGASHCVTRGVLNRFGPLPSGALFEDRTLALRSQLFGRVVYLPEPLVKYRVHEAGISNPDLYRSSLRLERWLSGMEVVQATLRADLSKAGVAKAKGVARAVAREERWLRRCRLMLADRLPFRIIGAWCYGRDRRLFDRIAFALTFAAPGGVFERAAKRVYKLLNLRGLNRSDKG